jgi:BirA family biotin operon repressor/biotin-[acetyl-CoA-carboxylase] ligase
VSAGSAGDLQGLTERLEAVIARERLAWFSRVCVVSETSSTQDFARRMGAPPGVVVIAGRQTRGRGRLGRTWVDPHDQGLAVTFVTGADTGGGLAVAAGVAACCAVEAVLAGAAVVGLKWPNDVVTRREDGGPGLKVAGVLVEQSGPVAMVGIGINVLQQPADWPADLAGRVASLHGLGAAVDRARMAEVLLTSLDRCLSMGAGELAREWSGRDVLAGRWCTFEHDRQRVSGRVEAIDASSHILLQTDSGPVRLPAATTTLIREGSG